MEYAEWEKYYEQILLDFGFERQKDEAAAMVLAQLSMGKNFASLEDLRELLRAKHAFIFGRGPSLEKMVKEYEYNGTIVAANGATSALTAAGILPHIIVTDLDGNVDDQLAANEKGAIVVILAHGDNIPALREHVPKFKGKIVPTSQSAPVLHLHSFGGFTDGDRAVFLADHFGARKITLVGFDFESDRGGTYDEDMDLSDRGKLKMRKLTWANVLIAMLDNPAIEFFNE